MLTSNDIGQLSARGISVQAFEKQIRNFREGFPYIVLEAPATVGNGMIRLSQEQVRSYADFFDQARTEADLLKFVPASGAATRMFKDLFEFTAVLQTQGVTFTPWQLEQKYPSIHSFFKHLDHFAFIGDLRKVIASQGLDLDDMIYRQDYAGIIHYLLDPKGLSYASLPKGLLAFHGYPGEVRTAVDEHLVEGAHYCKDKNGQVAIHFTVSPEHLDAFRQQIGRRKGYFEKQYGVVYHIDFSVQKPSTDTVAVDMHNEPFRNPDGSLLFRPAGHGALIENLNDLGSDIIFIKNIDNVVSDNLKPENYLYKKALAGYLLTLRKKVFSWIRKLESDQVTDAELTEIQRFAEDNLFMDIPAMKGMDRTVLQRVWIEAFHRPIRVCGMVRNAGEPGGGPFWIRDRHGRISLQIVESSQVNMLDVLQKAQFQQATHFNPVDLVCGIKDYKGNKFNLIEYVDPETGFISVKSKDGKELKALELPGLWNGAMASWITVFIEVPLITFNPVKIINDLLRKEHQVTN